jgi:ribonuclease P/MRP protein subunit POP1
MIGGLVERRNQYRECGVPSFPEHYGVTCPAGAEWEGTKATEEKARWDKKPPAKRPQYAVLGTSDPWKPDWQRVLDSRKGEDEEMEMNATKMESIQPWLFTYPLVEHITTIVNASEPMAILLKLINAFRSQRGLGILESTLAEELYSTALVQVKVEMDGRGSPGDMAIIYSLDMDERTTWLRAKERDRQYGRADWTQSDAEPKSELQKVCHFVVAADNQLGEVAGNSKNTIGYTTTGNFSLSRGCGYALATISLKGFVQAAKLGDGQVIVKVKNRDGRLCRLAKLHLV